MRRKIAKRMIGSSLQLVLSRHHDRRTTICRWIVIGQVITNLKMFRTVVTCVTRCNP
ncbi:hypothetical protein GALMADRAFT_755412 [Galerina marginata CBS 339.88]|uniref:Uncharacterized protein n=1 Tax=Galerina marginata (strain CBS 339.88) TaxID=685588 RepID=A0A067SRC9_GALM3|nr:hypothetical protein GALMADRAFT_755412 [Galerina marginata CBS 339.88]